MKAGGALQQEGCSTAEQKARSRNEIRHGPRIIRRRARTMNSSPGHGTETSRRTEAEYPSSREWGAVPWLRAHQSSMRAPLPLHELRIQLSFVDYRSCWLHAGRQEEFGDFTRQPAATVHHKHVDVLLDRTAVGEQLPYRTRTLNIQGEPSLCQNLGCSLINVNTLLESLVFGAPRFRCINPRVNAWAPVSWRSDGRAPGGTGVIFCFSSDPHVRPLPRETQQRKALFLCLYEDFPPSSFKVLSQLVMWRAPGALHPGFQSDTDTLPWGLAKRK
ncbi:hypothetical protein EYF80_001721 [Liparis tanakae]|uniref:Uncharacterized protein n=1 Tax=Liparis tanakae TaxID=230148 RepID=A0A4Z2JDA0_9TELE|nr:hypothetical protein EYF80_001721 [Liparis tanakae]